MTYEVLDAEALAECVPNLDCTDPSDLLIARNEFKEVAKVFLDLASYAETTMASSRCRLAGNIVLAQQLEGYNQKLYAKLPDWAKW